MDVLGWLYGIVCPVAFGGVLLIVIIYSILNWHGRLFIILLYVQLFCTINGYNKIPTEPFPETHV